MTLLSPVTMLRRSCLIGVFLFVGGVVAQPSTEQIRVISDQIWMSDTNRINGPDVQYDEVNGPPLFISVNEARFTGTYAALIALMPHYNAFTGTPDVCNSACAQAKENFLDAILQTQPISLVHDWLVSFGLASSSLSGFKEELRQYFFLPYTRSGGALDSSGFEHVFLGEIDDNEPKGFHNWVQAYFTEQSGEFIYGPYDDTCPNQNIKFSFTYYDLEKPVSGFFVRTSPELEIALYTLCLRTRIGTGCPTRRNGVDFTMTVWDMTGLPLTVGSAYPNC